MRLSGFKRLFPIAAIATLACHTLPAVAAAWAPTKTVEFIVPAGTGGGADQMARLIQGIVTKNNSAEVSTWVSGIAAALVVLNTHVGFILGAIMFGGIWFILGLVLSVAVAAAVEKGDKD